MNETNLGELHATELAMRRPGFDPHLLHQLSQALMATARPTVFRLLRFIATFSLRKNSEAK